MQGCVQRAGPCRKGQQQELILQLRRRSALQHTTALLFPLLSLSLTHTHTRIHNTHTDTTTHTHPPPPRQHAHTHTQTHTQTQTHTHTHSLTKAAHYITATQTDLE